MEAEASRTAVLVCQARAVADGRLAVGRFSDPVAARLLRDAERSPVDRIRGGLPARGLAERFQTGLLGGTALVLAARTVAIDEAATATACPQVVLLGAGLDGRAYRLGGIAGAHVFEVDHPMTQRDKRARASGLEPIAQSLTYVPVDFRHDCLASALAESGHDAALPTTWIWEGVLPYLTDDAVRSTLDIVGRRSAAGSRLIATYPTSNRLASVGRHLFRVATTLLGVPNPLETEPHVSAWQPEEMAALIAAYGFTVTVDQELCDVAERLAIPTGQVGRRMGRVVVADR